MNLNSLVDTFKACYPDISFKQGNSFLWSPKDKTVYYTNKVTNQTSTWSLIHEVSHALLGHAVYESDFELLKIEVEAWDKAHEIAKYHKINIDDDYIQDCIDTYRNWLYARSSCPSCSHTNTQENPTRYRCFNCTTTWTVSESRLCRPYRLTDRTNSLLV